MNMRHLALATLIIIASLGAPLLASAQNCTGVSEGCSFGGRPGTCVFDSGKGGLYCETTASTGGSGTIIGTQSGGTGTVNPTMSPPSNSGAGTTLINPLQGGGSLEGFLFNILAFVIRIGTIVVILMTVFVGYKFVAARGEPGKITEARSMLLWTVVGALILLGSQAIAIGIKATVQALSVGQ